MKYGIEQRLIEQESLSRSLENENKNFERRLGNLEAECSQYEKEAKQLNEELRNSNDLDSAIALSFRGLFDVTVRKIKPYDGNKFFYGDENSDEFIRVTYKPSRSYIPLVNNRRNRKIEKFSFEEEKKADDLKNK